MMYGTELVALADGTDERSDIAPDFKSNVATSIVQSYAQCCHSS